MTDNDKLNFIQKYFIEYIQSWKILSDFNKFIKNITKTKVITALKNRIQTDTNGSNEVNVNEQKRIEMLTNFNNEVDKL